VGDPADPSVDRGFTDHDMDGHHKLGYEQLSPGTTDCLIVAGYEDFPPRHDYLLVDVDRFCGDTYGKVVLGVVSPGWEVHRSSVWPRRRPVAAPSGTVPLVFHRTGAAEPGDDLAKGFNGWLAVLDRLLKGDLAPDRPFSKVADPLATLAAIRDAV